MAKKNTIITAKDIVRLLATKHNKDVFITEAKNGPTWTAAKGEMLKLDGWAMKRSWASPKFWGYEIKVSRSDFLGDDKWRGYLPLCTDFYFVCPTGLIDPDELPPEVGLLYVAKTGTRLFTKKKAQWRDIELPRDFLLHLLMSRLGDLEESIEPSHSESYWREWLSRKEDRQDIGYAVSRRLRELHSKRVIEVSLKNDWLKSENEKLAHVKEIIEDLGIDTWRYSDKVHIEDKMEKLWAGKVVKAVEDITKQLNELYRDMKNIEGK